MEKYNELIALQRELLRLSTEHWFEDVFLTFPWWFVMITLFLPWIIWWKIVDKTKIREISLVGLFIMMISFLMDQIGASLVLWSYPVTTTHLPRDVFDPADLAILPFFYMVMYQYFPEWKPYLFIQIVFALFASYVGGNLFQWLGIYKILNWKHIFSVPIYLLMGIVVKWILIKLTKIETG